MPDRLPCREAYRGTAAGGSGEPSRTRFAHPARRVCDTIIRVTTSASSHGEPSSPVPA